MIEIREENPTMGDELHSCNTTQEAMKILREATESRGKFIVIDGNMKSYDTIDSEMLANANEIALTGKLKGG